MSKIVIQTTSRQIRNYTKNTLTQFIAYVTQNTVKSFYLSINKVNGYIENIKNINYSIKILRISI